MSDGDIGQLWCLYIVADCLTMTPSPFLHTYIHPHTYRQTRTLSHSQSFENTALHPCVHSHMDAHKLTQLVLEFSYGLRTIRSECQWHETKANELEWRLKRSTLSAPINLPTAKRPCYSIWCTMPFRLSGIWLQKVTMFSRCSQSFARTNQRLCCAYLFFVHLFFNCLI